MTVKWTTKEVKSMLFLKDNSYPACQIYEGTSVCEETYICEIIQNVYIRWNEHENMHMESEPAKHFKGESEPQM